MNSISESKEEGSASSRGEQKSDSPPSSPEKAEPAVRSWLWPAAGVALLVVVSGAIFLTFYLSKSSNSSDKVSVLIPRSWYADKDSNPENVYADMRVNKELRLPINVFPSQYHLALRINVPYYGIYYNKDEHNKFEGAVSIIADIKENTYTIHMHASRKWTELRVLNVENTRKQENLTVSSMRFIGDDIIRIDIIEKMKSGDEIRINIRYGGRMNEDVDGFYYSTIGERSEAKYYVVTDLKPTKARNMVPCFDEPEFKAKWVVAIIHPNGTRALSNSPKDTTAIQAEKSGGYWITSVFKETPLMSSYLLGIAIIDEDWKHVTTKTDSGTEIHGYSRGDVDMKRTVDYAKQVLKMYEEKFEMIFPLDKIDILAVPNFEVATSESWGLLVFRETVLLEKLNYGRSVPTEADERRVIANIAHELAHQWFGNLVTMAWWDDLWLNEGFATLMMYMSVNELKRNNYPNLWLNAHQVALQADSVSANHPLTFSITDTEDFETSYDDISYRKGAAVLEMLQKMVGDHRFMHAVSLYLKKFSFKNTRTEDLYMAFDHLMKESQTGADGDKMEIAEVAEKWTKRIGFPLVTVRRLNSNTVELIQKKFKLLNDSNGDWKYHSINKTKWDIPIWYQILRKNNDTEDANVKNRWFTAEQNLRLNLHEDDVIIINGNGYGFYRVRYDPSIFKNIIQLLKDDKGRLRLNANARATILSDAYACAQIGAIQYKELFELEEYIFNEDDLLPRLAQLQGFDKLSDYFKDTQYETVFYKYRNNHLLPRIAPGKAIAPKKTDELAYDDALKSNEYNHFVQESMFGCVMTDEDCIRKSDIGIKAGRIMECNTDMKLSACDGLLTLEKKRESNAALCFIGRAATKENFENLMNWLSIEDDGFVRESILGGLSCSTDPININRLLKDAIQTPPQRYVRYQEIRFLFNVFTENSAARKILPKFLKDNWDDFLKLSKQLRRTTASIVKDSLAYGDEDDLKYWKNQMLSHKSVRRIPAMIESVERLTARLRWKQSNFQSVADHYQSIVAA